MKRRRALPSSSIIVLLGAVLALTGALVYRSHDAHGAPPDTTLEPDSTAALTAIWERLAVGRGVPRAAASDSVGPSAEDDGFAILRRLVQLSPSVVTNMVVPGSALDVDGNGRVDALTDGLLIVRHMTGLRGNPLIRDAFARDAVRVTAAELEAHIDAISPILDVDGNGVIDAATDGELIIRFAFGFNGIALTEGAVAADAIRTTPDDIASYLNVLADPTDSDGDGLTNSQEVAGYEIIIDNLGLGTHDPGWESTLTRLAVTSNPFDPDTDDDQMNDFVERLFRTHPGRIDTDADELSDIDELMLYGSTPTSVDSDGDARGPGLNLTPNPTFFDGNELRIYGTSPALADTDGDDATDFEEANQDSTRPLVADVPGFAVELVGDVDLTLDVTDSENTANTESAQSTLAQAQTTGFSRTDSTTSQWSIEASLTVGAEVSAGVPGGAEATAKTELTVTGGYGEERTAAFTEDSSRTAQEEFQNLQEQTKSFGREVNGGAIGMGLRVVNTGPVAFTLSNLIVTALMKDPAQPDQFRTIATLTPPVDAVTLGPFNGRTGILRVDTSSESGNVSGDLIRSLMSNPSGLQFDVATFDLLDQEGRNFAFLANTTNSRTALLTIDFGNGDVERFRVATNIERNPDGTSAGVRMEKILNDIVNVPFETTPRAPDPINPLPENPEFPYGEQLLTKVRDVEVSADDNAFWVVLSAEERHNQVGQNFEDIVIKAGESISLAYVTDFDEDGLFAREEFLHGTVDRPMDFNGDGVIDAEEVDRASDFDNDTLDDFLEVRTGWTVEVEGRAPRTVFPSPIREDVDGDGLTDQEELRGRDDLLPTDAGDTGDATDPNNPDTDGDGLDDIADDDPTSNFNAPPTITLFAPVSGSVVTLQGSIVDGLDAIASVAIDWDDGTDVEVITPPSSFDPFSINHQYALSGDYNVRVTARDDRAPPGLPGVAETILNVEIIFPNDALVRYLFNSNFEDTAPAGMNLDGTQTGNPDVAFVDGRFGASSRAACFAAGLNSGNAVNLPHVPFGTEGQLTIAAWILPDDLDRGNVFGQQDYARLFLDTGNAAFEIETGGSPTRITDPTSPTRGPQGSCSTGSVVPQGDWTFYAVTVRQNGTGGSELRMYRGSKPGTDRVVVQEVAGVDLPSTVFTNPDSSSAEIASTSETNGYEGRIDDVRVYNRALDIGQINELLNEGPN